jgi:membrane associated rhomboid family serine protease
MVQTFTLILLITIFIWSTIGFFFKRFYFSCIFHPCSFLNFPIKHSVLTYSLIHFNFSHLALNLSVLYLFSDDLEIFLVKECQAGYLIALIFIVSSIAGALINLFMKKSVIEFSMVGASHGVFGLLAAYFILKPQETIKFLPIEIPNNYLFIVIIIITYLNHRVQKSQIDFFGHFCGLITGGAMALAIK